MHPYLTSMSNKHSQSLFVVGASWLIPFLTKLGWFKLFSILAQIAELSTKALIWRGLSCQVLGLRGWEDCRTPGAQPSSLCCIVYRSLQLNTSVPWAWVKNSSPSQIFHSHLVLPCILLSFPWHLQFIWFYLVSSLDCTSHSLFWVQFLNTHFNTHFNVYSDFKRYYR